MAQKKTVKRVTRKKRPTRRKNKSTKRTYSTLGRAFSALLLMLILVLSIVVVGYVIFFRVVVAAELTEQSRAADIVFEEPEALGRSIIEETDIPPVPASQPLVAIIIDDMGYHEAVGWELLALDLDLSFSFLPYAPFTKEMEEKAYQLGRTVMLHLPLEPRNNKWNPGPGALYLRDDHDRQKQVFEDNLQRVPHATGINNHMGSRYTENEEQMSRLLELIADRQFFFIDSYTTAESRGMQKAEDKGVPTARRHVFLDNEQRTEEICRQLKKLVELAEKQHAAVGIAHPHPETAEAFKTCAPAILAGVSLVGAAKLVQ